MALHFIDAETGRSLQTKGKATFNLPGTIFQPLKRSFTLFLARVFLVKLLLCFVCLFLTLNGIPGKTLTFIWTGKPEIYGTFCFLQGPEPNPQHPPGLSCQRGPAEDFLPGTSNHRARWTPSSEASPNKPPPQWRTRHKL